MRWIEFAAEDHGNGLVIRLLSYEDKRNLEESTVAGAFVTVSERGTLIGVLAPTSVSQGLRVRVLPMGTDSQLAAWSTADEQLTLGLLADWFDAYGESLAASMIRTNTTTVHRTLISGYIFNTIWLALLGVTVYSFGWLRDIGRESLARQRLARGQCPSCAYPFDGLPTRICPECGEELPLTRTATD